LKLRIPQGLFSYGNVAEGNAELGARQMNPLRRYESSAFFSLSMNFFFAQWRRQLFFVLARISTIKAMKIIFGRDGG
jgi:hypothetical protein